VKRPEDQLAVIARKPLGIAHASSGITTVGYCVRRVSQIRVQVDRPAHSPARTFSAPTASAASRPKSSGCSSQLAYLALPAAYRPGRRDGLDDQLTLQADPPTLISVKRLDELQRFYVTGVTDPLRKSPNAAERALAAGVGKSGRPAHRRCPAVLFHSRA